MGKKKNLGLSWFRVAEVGNLSESAKKPQSFRKARISKFSYFHFHMEGGRGGLATGWRNLAVTRSQFKMICVLSQRWAHCTHFPQLQRCFFQGKLNIVITREFLTQLMCWAAARNHRCCNLEKSHRIMFSLQGKPYIHNNKIYPGNLSNEQVNIWISFFFCTIARAQQCPEVTI